MPTPSTTTTTFHQTLPRGVPWSTSAAAAPVRVSVPQGSISYVMCCTWWLWLLGRGGGATPVPVGWPRAVVCAWEGSLVFFLEPFDVFFFFFGPSCSVSGARAAAPCQPYRAPLYTHTWSPRCCYCWMRRGGLKVCRNLLATDVGTMQFCSLCLPPCSFFVMLLVCCPGAVPPPSRTPRPLSFPCVRLCAEFERKHRMWPRYRSP